MNRIDPIPGPLRKLFLVLLILFPILLNACASTPPPVPLRIVATMSHYTNTSGRIPVGSTGAVTASCKRGEQMLSGGYTVDAFESANVMSSYPSGPNSWTVSTINNASPDWIVLSASVNCLRANVSVGAHIVHEMVHISSGKPQSATVNCPAGAVVTGGGYKTTGFVAASAPRASGWNAVLSGGSRAEVFAVCATQHVRAAPPAAVPFMIEQCFGCSGSGQAKCGAGQLLTGGGFSSADGDNRFLENAAGPDFSGWFVLAAGDGYSPTTPHPSAWATCVLFS